MKFVFFFCSLVNAIRYGYLKNVKIITIFSTSNIQRIIMLGTNKIKFITSLSVKKYRDKHKLFIAEGSKIVNDVIKSGYNIHQLIAAPQWIESNNDLTERVNTRNQYVADSKTLKKTSLLKTPPEVIAIVRQPEYAFREKNYLDEPALILDGVQNPGNLGTIIRIADWFGVPTIICSLGCADVYNPKTIQAGMGSITRVKVFYFDLVEFFDNTSKKADSFVYGCDMHGENVYSLRLKNNGKIVLGSEGQGISQEIMRYIDQYITIPCFSKALNKPDSLNVSTAAAIFCSELKRD